MGKESLSERGVKKIKPNPGDTSVMLGGCPSPPKSHSGFLVRVLPRKAARGGARVPIPQPREPGEVYAESRKAICHTKGQSTGLDTS